MGTFTQREDCEEFWVTDDKRATPKLWGATEISQPFVIFMLKKEKRFPAFPVNQVFFLSVRKRPLRTERSHHRWTQNCSVKHFGKFTYYFLS